jgi:TRAP-type C4-dicarboxylate transport system substrate-binding protein
MKNERFRSKVSIIVLTMIFSLVLFGLTNIPEAQAQQKVWKLKIQAFTVPGKFECQWVVPLKFVELLKKHTAGRLDCSLHPAGELVGARETWTAVSAGTIDGGCTLDIYQGGTHPEFCFDTGAIWSIDEFFKVMHTGALDILNQQTTSEGLRIVGYFPLMNYYAVSMKNQHIKRLEDLKGKKIRGMGGAANQFLEKANAGIVTLPMSEVAPALQTGVVDGIHTGMAGLYAMNLWDVAPFFTSSRCGNFGFYILFNEAIYQGFPPDIKMGIAAAQKELEAWYTEWDAKFWKEIKADVEGKGIKWYDLPADESQRWRALLTQVSYNWVMQRNPKVGKMLFDVVEKSTGRPIQ